MSKCVPLFWPLFSNNSKLEKLALTIVEDVTDIRMERLAHQDFTYLIKQIDTIIFCYAFIGKSFNGMKKLNEFSNLVQSTSQVWESLKSMNVEKLSLDQSIRFSLTQFIDNIFV